MTQPPRGFPNWEELYRSGGVEGLPWYYPTLDPDLEAALARHGLAAGRILDQGTGPGTQAIALAERGFTVTATDISPAAIAYASGAAKTRSVAVTFLVDDVLSSALEGPFDAVFDRGCFHVLAPEQREAYARAIHRLLAPAGLLFLKTFSHLQPGTEGPHRFTPDAIREVFAARSDGARAAFEVLEVQETEYQGQRDPFPKALMSVIRRA